MGFGRLVLLVVMPLIVACKVLPQGGDAPPPVAVGQDGGTDAALASGAAIAADGQVRPKPRPALFTQGNEAVNDPDPAVRPPLETEPKAPVVQKTKEQIVCEKRGGDWGNAGKSQLKICIQRTRDAGKQCRKQGDCSSVCLARSRTCAPVKPLFGCNEILQKDGSRVTLCID